MFTVGTVKTGGWVKSIEKKDPKYLEKDSMEASIHDKKTLIQAITMAVLNTFLLFYLKDDPFQKIYEVQYLFLICDVIIMFGFYGSVCTGYIADLAIICKMALAIFFVVEEGMTV